MELEELLKKFEELNPSAGDEVTRKVGEEIKNSIDEYTRGLVENKSKILENLSTAKKERDQLLNNKTELEKKLEKFNKIEDPDFALEAIEKVKMNKTDTVNVDVEVEKRVASMKKDFETRINTLGEENQELKFNNQKLVNNNRTTKFEFVIGNVANKIGIDPRASEDFISRAFNTFKYDEDESDFVPVDRNGDRIASPDPKKPYATPEEWGKELKNSAPHLFKNNINPELNGGLKTSNNYELMFKLDDKGRIIPTSEGKNLRASDSVAYERVKKQAEVKLRK